MRAQQGGAPQRAYLQALEAARRALARKDLVQVRRMARQAARLQPHQEAPWLFLAVASEPRAGLAYAARALELDPSSQAARQTIRWLARRLPERQRRAAMREAHLSQDLIVGPASMEALTMRRLVSPGVLAIAAGLAIALGVWFGYQPADAQQPQLASAPLAKATFTPTPTNTPTVTPTPAPTNTPPPTSTPTPTTTPTPRPNVSWTYSEDHTDLADEGRWIDVDLSAQRVTAYQGASPVRTFMVSTGTAAHPTVTGQFRVYVKLVATDMAGPGYYLPDVPYTMYFYRGYALHGTYWHNNFGTPMSHGCVNLSIPDAQWLFNFASVGTLVNVHP